MDLSASTNLALRPFRNERLPWLLASLLLVLALGVSVVHARLIDRILSGDEANTVRVVREDEQRIAELEEAISLEPPLKVEPAELQRLRAFKDLVDRRVFPWRLLLAELEETLSGDVRLTRISPGENTSGRGMLIELSGEARTKEDAFSMAEALDASPLFSNAVLRSMAEIKEGIDFEVEVVFDPDQGAKDTRSAPLPPQPAEARSPGPNAPRTR